MTEPKPKEPKLKAPKPKEPKPKDAKLKEPKEKEHHKVEMHLKGGCGIQAIRWTFVGFCALLFVISVSVLTLSAVNYAEMRVAFDELRSQKKYDFNPNHIFNKFEPEPALGIFYLGMALGTTFTLISCIGSCGAACLERCFLIVFVVSLSIVLFGSILAMAIIVNIYKDDLQSLAEELFKEFVIHLYGRNDLLTKIWTNAIDNVQRKHSCCGVLELLSENATRTKYGAWPAQYTLLYWLESTQWGQIQANNIRYNESRWLNWAPKSCCKNEQIANCSSARFGARLDNWTSEMEHQWKDRINVGGCGRHLLDFTHMEPAERAKVIAVAICSIVTMLATIVMGCWLCQAVSAYEFSSRDSELDQKRHRRGRRNRLRLRLKRRRRRKSQSVSTEKTADSASKSK